MAGTHRSPEGTHRFMNFTHFSTTSIQKKVFFRERLGLNRSQLVTCWKVLAYSFMQFIWFLGAVGDESEERIFVTLEACSDSPACIRGSWKTLFQLVDHFMVATTLGVCLTSPGHFVYLFWQNSPTSFPHLSNGRGPPTPMLGPGLLETAQRRSARPGATDCHRRKQQLWPSEAPREYLQDDRRRSRIADGPDG